MYHDKTAPEPGLETWQAAWRRIVDSAAMQGKTRFSVVLLGGELTIMPDFMPFMRWIQSEYHAQLDQLGLVTNGTASASVYTELVHLCTWLAFSTHSEFMSESKFFRNVLQARDANPKCLVTVNIMDEPWHRDRIEEYKQFLDRHQVAYYLHPILDFGDQRDPYPVRKFQRINLDANS